MTLRSARAAREMRALRSLLREGGLSLDHDLLDREEEDLLLALAEAGDRDAVEALVRSNVRLVFKEVGRVIGRAKRVQAVDLFAVGMDGFMHAVEKFDRSTGNRLSTYATLWIRQRLGRALDMSDWVVRPTPKYLGLMRELGMFRAVAAAEGIQPTTADAAHALEIPWEEADRLERTVRGVDSLSRPVGEGDDRLGDLIEGSDGDSAVEGAHAESVEMLVRGLMGTLPALHRRVLATRFGMDGGEPLSLVRSAAALGLTRHVVARVEREALEALRETLEERRDRAREEAAA